MFGELVADGVVGGERVVGLRGVGGEVGFEEARFDERDFDAEGVEFVGEGFGVAFEGEFGCGVEAMAWDADAACERGDIDDSSFADVSHDGEDGVGDSDEAEEVGFEDLMDLLEGGFFGGAVEDDAGVVDEDVDSSCAVEDGLDALGDGVVGLDVEGEEGEVLVLGRIFFSGGSEDLVALVGEEFCGLEAKAFGGTGDEDDIFIVGHNGSLNKRCWTMMVGKAQYGFYIPQGREGVKLEEVGSWEENCSAT